LITDRSAISVLRSNIVTAPPALTNPPLAAPSPGVERLAPIRPGSGRWLALVVGVAVALCLPFMHAVFAISDEGVLLNGAARMLRGDRLYLDFFEFLPPGGFLLTEGWFSLFGLTIFSVRSLAALTVAGIACVTYLACRQASRNAPLSALVTIAWLVMSQGGWTQVSHHWFTTLFSMLAAWTALKNADAPKSRFGWALLSGASAGVAAMITPTRGALAMMAAATAFVSARGWGKVAFYLLGCVLAPLGFIAWLIWNHAIARAFYDVIEWTAGRYAPVQAVPFGSFASSQNIPLLFLFPAAAAALIGVCVQDWRNARRDAQLRSCAAFALAGFAGSFPRPDIVHISFAAPLALPLLACCLTRLKVSLRPAFWYALIGVTGFLFASSVAGYMQTVRLALGAEAANTPRGAAGFALRPVIAPLIARIAATPADEKYFFYPYMPMLPFLAARPQVSQYEIFTPGYILPSQYRDACDAVLRDADWVVIDRVMADPRSWKQTFPAMKDAQPPETRKFEQVLDSAFEFVSREGEFELRRRQEAIDPNSCAGIEG
jgi:4-amino-4-deoxy-L-arabinose transferase-like glycosyltransferase